MLQVKRLHDKAILPKRGTPQAAGYDLSSCEEAVVPAKGRKLVKTGLAIAVPSGNYGRVAPRSGLALKNFIDTGAGVIDEDYRGECKNTLKILVNILLFNHSDTDFQVNYGDRIAQLIIEKITHTEIVEVETLSDTERGAGGFGSTGVAMHQNGAPKNGN